MGGLTIMMHETSFGRIPKYCRRFFWVTKLLRHVSMHWDMQNPHLTMEAELYQPGTCACGGFCFLWHSWPMLLFEGIFTGKSGIEVLFSVHKNSLCQFQWFCFQQNWGSSSLHASNLQLHEGCFCQREIRGMASYITQRNSDGHLGSGQKQNLCVNPGTVKIWRVISRMLLLIRNGYWYFLDNDLPL
jgi:hypothetical protein